MDSKTSVPVTVCIISYNRKEIIVNTINSILQQSVSPTKIMLVDNASTDGTTKLVIERFPDVEVIALNKNLGPNVARNIGLKEADTKYVLLVDDDVLLENNSLNILFTQMEAEENYVISSPIVVYAKNPKEVQYGGTMLHYIGAGVSNTGDIETFQKYTRPYKVSALAAAAIMIRRDIVNQVGWFDEDLFFGWTDGEFCARVTLAGYDCVIIPTALARHDVQPRSKAMMYYQIRNRWLFILRVYQLKTILVILPALLLYEVILFALSISVRQARAYFKANMSVIEMLPATLAKRKFTQSTRKISDTEILTSGTWSKTRLFDNNAFFGFVMKLINMAFNVYWKIIKIVI